MQGMERAPVVVKRSECLAEVLISLACILHAIEGTHEYAVELDCLTMQRTLNMLKTLYGLFLCDCILCIIKSNLAYICDGLHIISALIQQSLHDALHLAALQCVFNPSLGPELPVFLSQKSVR